MRGRRVIRAMRARRSSSYSDKSAGGGEGERVRLRDADLADLADLEGLEDLEPVWKSPSESGSQSFTKSFLGDDAAMRAKRAVRELHRHAVEQASRRWRGRHDSAVAETRRDNLISTQQWRLPYLSRPLS